MSSEIPRHWRLKDQRYSLVGEQCPHCEVKIFPPRDICPNCHGEAKVQYQFSGKGEVYSSTIMYDAPSGFENTPYQVALIKLDEGPILTAQLTDLSDATELVPIGTKVEMVTRIQKDDQEKKGVIVYGYKFRIPVTSSTQT